MHLVRLRVYAVVALVFLLSGCGDLLGTGGDRPPILTGISPVTEEEGVSVLAPIVLEFSKAVPEAVAPGAVTLWDGQRQILTQASLGNRNRILQLQPTDPLDFGTTYRVALSDALTLREGSLLQQGGSWEFSTEGLAPPVPDLDSLILHLEALAHDSMRGRLSGSEEELKAAGYLRDRFALYGLENPPGGAIHTFEAFARRQDRDITSQNVLAVVEGSGSLSQEWVVLGAHYDHVGFRGLPDETQGPNNGADDNGSGTVLILEMARAFQAYVDAGGTGSRDRRSVLFAAWGAEEEGLLGSCNYVHYIPAVPLGQTRALMNFDMVGRLRENTVYLSGGDVSPAWGPMARNANDPLLNLAFGESSCTGCTDHACFWQAGIPFMGFFTGLHNEYHRPGDDIELIDFTGMVRIGNLSLRVLSRLTVTPSPPPLTKTYPSEG